MERKLVILKVECISHLWWIRERERGEGKREKEIKGLKVRASKSMNYGKKFIHIY